MALLKTWVLYTVHVLNNELVVTGREVFHKSPVRDPQQKRLIRKAYVGDCASLPWAAESVGVLLSFRITRPALAAKARMYLTWKFPMEWRAFPIHVTVNAIIDDIEVFYLLTNI